MQTLPPPPPPNFIYEQNKSHEILNLIWLLKEVTNHVTVICSRFQISNLMMIYGTCTFNLNVLLFHPNCHPNNLQDSIYQNIRVFTNRLKTVWILISWLLPADLDQHVVRLYLLKLIYKWIKNSVDPDQLASMKPADLDQHCFPKQDINYWVKHERIKD